MSKAELQGKISPGSNLLKAVPELGIAIIRMYSRLPQGLIGNQIRRWVTVEEFTPRRKILKLPGTIGQ